MLEGLREPLENRTVMVSRSRVQAQYPAAFRLIAAMNPCPCGHRGESSGRCRCTPGQVAAFRARISGPLLDRIDLFIEVPRVPLADIGACHAARGAPMTAAASLTSGTAAASVACARQRQLRRDGCLNGELSSSQLQARVRPTRTAALLLEQVFERLGLTARSYQRVLRVVLTIADLADSEAIEAAHVAEAVQLRRAADDFSCAPAR